MFTPVPGSEYPYAPVVVALSSAHDLVYVVYVGIPSLPILVQFRATPLGLKYQWQQEVSTGDPTLQGTTISDGPGVRAERVSLTRAVDRATL